MTSQNPFKYIRKDEFENCESPILFFFTEETLQEYAEANFGRELSEDELQLAYEEWISDYTNEGFLWFLHTVICNTINKLTNY